MGQDPHRYAYHSGIHRTGSGELSRYLVSGELVTDRLVIEIIRHRLGDPDASSGFILDGFPRTSAQGEALDSMLALLQRPIDLAIYLAISAAALIERLSHRHREDDRPAVFAVGPVGGEGGEVALGGERGEQGD